MIAKTPNPPYYAVIFSSILTGTEQADYLQTAKILMALAEKQDGFLGMESARNELGITVSYWSNLEAIKEWKHQTDHVMARQKGKTTWYKQFKVRIAVVEKEYGFSA